MNEIKLFNDLTTEKALSALEDRAKSYEGLYVEMDDKEQRGYVKKEYSLINDLLKKLDRARIDKAKAYKSAVEEEAAQIKARLQRANEPFTLLLDEWNEKRAKILAEKKRKEEEAEAIIQLEKDHEEAIQLNRLWDLEEKEREASREAERLAQIEREKQIAEDAAKQALVDAENKRLANIKREEEEKAKREANKQYLASVNNDIVSVLIANGINEEDAKTMVRLAAKGQLPKLTINY